MTEFDPVRYAQLRQTKAKVGQAAPAALNAELAALCAAEMTHTPSPAAAIKAQVLAEIEAVALREQAVREINGALAGTIETSEPQELLDAITELRPIPEPLPVDPVEPEDISDHKDPEPKSLFQRVFGA